jgi:hypothetical protein
MSRTAERFLRRPVCLGPQRFRILLRTSASFTECRVRAGSGRWEANPNGGRFKVYKMQGFVKRGGLRAIGVRIFALQGQSRTV